MNTGKFVSVIIGFSLVILALVQYSDSLFLSGAYTTWDSVQFIVKLILGALFLFVPLLQKGN